MAKKCFETLKLHAYLLLNNSQPQGWLENNKQAARFCQFPTKKKKKSYLHS